DAASEAPAQLDRDPSAVGLRHDDEVPRAGRLHDRERVGRELLVPDVSVGAPRASVAAPVERDHPPPRRQLLGERPEEGPAHGPPGKAKERRPAARSALVVGDLRSAGAGALRSKDVAHAVEATNGPGRPPSQETWGSGTLEAS